jgi:trk/ktr system potassium uptake protein
MVGVLHILSQVLGVLAFALLLPAAISLATGDGLAESYLVIAGLVGFLAGAFFFGLRGREANLNRASGFVLVVAIWVVPPLIAAVPIMQNAHVSYIDGLFEAVSGFTTTGATVLKLATLTPATIFWRAELQWFGGLATLLTFVTVLAPAGIGGLSSRAVSTVGEYSDTSAGRAWRAIRSVTIVYSAATAVCIVLLFASGMPTFDAICIAFSTISTGGFMPVDGNLSVYANPVAETVILIFMLIGATSIAWYRILLQGQSALLIEHRETYWVAAVALLAGLGYAIVFAGLENFVAALGEGLFTGASLISTTGFETRLRGLAALPDTIVFFLAIGGGAALSTAGGIKYYRIGGMFVQTVHELQKLIFPHSVRSTRFGSQPYDLALMKAIWAYLVAGVVVLMAGGLVLSLDLPTFDAALLASASAFSNIGPLYSPEWPIGQTWPSYAAFSDLSQVAMAVVMILGRIEILVLLAALNLAYWRS